MNRKQRTTLVLAALGGLLIALFPPFYGIRLPRQAGMRCNLGRHAIWNPPDSALVQRKWLQKYPRPESSAKEANREEYQAHINVVKWGAQAGLLLLSALALLLLQEPRGGRGQSALGAVFWNRGEQRLRALWRLALGFIFLFAFSILIFLLARELLPAAVSARYAEPIGAAAAFPAIWMLCRVVDRRPLKALGLRFNRRWWTDFAFGAVLATLSWLAIFAVGYLTGWISITATFWTPRAGSSFSWAFVVSLLFFAFLAAREELEFRGYLLTNLLEGFSGGKIPPGWSTGMAVVLSAAAFGLIHLTNAHAGLLSTLSASLGGLLLGLTYGMTRELAIPFGYHLFWNFSQCNLFGFTVSGDYSSTASLVKASLHGPALWIGDRFGPESGLLAILAVALGCGLCVAWIRWRRGRE